MKTFIFKSYENKDCCKKEYKSILKKFSTFYNVLGKQKF